MKKILCLALVTLMIGCTFGVAGCEADDGIEFTAEKPIYIYKYSPLENWEEIEEGEMRSTINGCDPIKGFSFYKDFSEYYVENLKGNKAYLLYRSNEIPPFTPDDKGTFGFYREKETGVLILEESYHLYDSELGTKPFDGTIPYQSVSVYLDIFIKAIDGIDLNELKLEFGKIDADKLEIPFYGPDKYINIYTGEICFATCYYNNHVTVPREWFENFFKENLIYGDDL